MVDLRSALEKNLRKYYFSVSILSRADDMSCIYVTNSTFDQNLWRKRDLAESIELWGTFDVRLYNTILSRMCTQEISFQQEVPQKL